MLKNQNNQFENNSKFKEKFFQFSIGINSIREGDKCEKDETDECSNKISDLSTEKDEKYKTKETITPTIIIGNNSKEEIEKIKPIDENKNMKTESKEENLDKNIKDKKQNKEKEKKKRKKKTKKTIKKIRRPKYYIPLKKIGKDFEVVEINFVCNLNLVKKNKINQEKVKPVTNIKNNIINNSIYEINNQKNIYNNQVNNTYSNLLGINKTIGLNPNNINIFNIMNNRNINNYNNNILNQLLAQIIEKEKNFENLHQLGLYCLNNPQNTNHYLLNYFMKNKMRNINNINNINNVNQFNPFNNNINLNCNNINNYGNNIYRNYLSQENFNNNLLNQNINNNILNQNIINNIKNQINPEKYTITLKSKTNDPTVEKISKIQVTTSYVKGTSKVKPETNNENTGKEKSKKNLINLEDIISGKEKRTVVRLNPIPPNYSSFDISKLLDKYLKIESGKNQRIYTALYTPLCKVIGKNLGYCFVMMAKPKYVKTFYDTFNGRSFGKKKCRKPCSVIWADIQGEEFLKNTEDDPIRKPIIFKDIIIEKDELNKGIFIIK